MAVERKPLLAPATAQQRACACKPPGHRAKCPALKRWLKESAPQPNLDQIDAELCAYYWKIGDQLGRVELPTRKFKQNR